MKLRNKAMLLAAAAGTLLLTNASQAAVTIIFSQVGGDVVATFTGSMVTPAIAQNNIFTGAPNILWVSTDRFLSFDVDGSVGGWGGGAPLPTGLSPRFLTSPGVGFGFFGAALYVPDSVGAATAYSPVGSVLFPGTTLAAMNASSFSNTLAYTAVNGEQIFYNTFAATIPEPGVGCLLSLGLGSFQLRRRRRN